MSLAFSPDGRRLAGMGLAPSEVRGVDVASGKVILTLKRPDLPKEYFVAALAFSPDGRWLASLHQDGVLTLWDAATGQELRAWKGHEPVRLCKIAFSPDGRRLAAPWHGKSIKVWDTGDGREVFTLEGHTEAVTGIALSPDGRRLATASDDSTLKVWDAESGRELLALRGHTGPVRGLAFSPDGRRLASAGEDGTVKLWDTTSGQEALTLKTDTRQVFAVAFSPDGRRLACGTETGLAMIWDAPQQVGEAQAARWQVLRETQQAWHQDSAAASERAGQWFAAVFHLSRLLDIEPDQAGFRVRRGQALALLGKPGEAKADFAKALEREDALTAADRAEALAGLARWPEAARLYAEAAESRSAGRQKRARHLPDSPAIAVIRRPAAIDLPASGSLWLDGDVILR
jgi:WD40 repeat protein